jgi:hypothetical protein
LCLSVIFRSWGGRRHRNTESLIITLPSASLAFARPTLSGNSSKSSMEFLNGDLNWQFRHTSCGSGVSITYKECIICNRRLDDMEVSSKNPVIQLLTNLSRDFCKPFALFHSWPWHIVFSLRKQSPLCHSIPQKALTTCLSSSHPEV